MSQQTAESDLASLKGQVAQAEAARIETETENGKLQTSLGQEKAQRVQSDLAAAASHLAAAEAEAAAAETAFAAAMKAGDATAASKATRAISSAQTRIDAWDGQKKRIEAFKEKMSKVQPQVEGGDQYTPATRAWLNRHQGIANDQKKMQKAYAGHFDALAEGLTPDTPEYFAHIEKQMGLSVAAAEVPESEAAVTVEPGASVTEPELEAEPEVKKVNTGGVAPVRKTPSLGKPSQDLSKIKLSPAQAEMARIAFPRDKPEEAYAKYANNIRELVKEGRMTL